MKEVIEPDDDTTNCKVDVEIDFESFLCDSDVVLTDYNNLTRNKSLFSSIHWHRIVLDECQEIKVATNKIASLVSVILLPKLKLISFYVLYMISVTH